jgi:hypothetical protein
MKTFIKAVPCLIALSKLIYAEPGTAVSMFMKSDGKQISRIESKVGDLYTTMGHHGPAVENAWAGYRIYFIQYMSVDILSKFQPRLELHKSQWYTLEKPELAGRNYGKDNYKIGTTVGLGGLRLWDASLVGKDKTVTLDVAKGTGGLRSAEVVQDGGSSSIRMVSKGVAYQGGRHDIEFTLRVYSGERFAFVTAKVLGDHKLQFVTGMTVHDQLKVVEQKENFLLAWGDYDSPAADEVFDVGTGLVFHPNDVQSRFRSKDEILIITKPLKQFNYLITTANGKEASKLNTIDSFRKHLILSVESLKKLTEAAMQKP